MTILRAFIRYLSIPQEQEPAVRFETENCARNILVAGHAVLACGGMEQSGRPLKQEPTGASQTTV